MLSRAAVGPADEGVIRTVQRLQLRCRDRVLEANQRIVDEGRRKGRLIEAKK